ncbi:MAG: hypothetical protein ACLQPH_01380, partial [Acidimicrobiales bacterium]
MTGVVTRHRRVRLGDAGPDRQADLDVVGHAKDAALWEAVSGPVGGPLDGASLAHHGEAVGCRSVDLVTGAGRLWLVVEGAVSASGPYSERSPRERLAARCCHPDAT